MNLRPIKTEQEYNLALERLDKIFLAQENTPEGDEAHILIMLIDEYEHENYKIDSPDPIEAIKLRLEEMNNSNFDINSIFGGEKSKLEILSKKKKLTLDLIRNLSEKLEIPPKILIQDY